MSRSRTSLAPNRSSLSPARRQSLQPGGIAPARRCGRHKLVLRPDGTCVVCEREGGPFASEVSGLRGRTLTPARPTDRPHPSTGSKARTGLWASLGVVFGVVGGTLLWLQLTDGPSNAPGTSSAAPRLTPAPATAATPAGELPEVPDPASATRPPGAQSGAQSPAAQRPAAQAGPLEAQPSDGQPERSNPLLDAQRRALEETPPPEQPYPAGSKAP